MVDYTGTDLEEMTNEELFALAVEHEIRVNIFAPDHEVTVNGKMIPNKILPTTLPYKGPDFDDIEAENARRIAARYGIAPEEFEQIRQDWAMNDGDTPATDELIKFREGVYDRRDELAGDVLARALLNIRSLNIEPNAITR